MTLPYAPLSAATFPVALQDRLVKIRGDFMASLQDRLGRLESLLNGDILAPDTITALVELSHTLAGAGGTFGLPELTITARQLEERFRTLAQDGADVRLDPRERQDVDRMLAAMRSAAMLPIMEAPPPDLAPSPESPPVPIVYLFRELSDDGGRMADDEGPGIAELADNIRLAGYSLAVLTDVDSLRQACLMAPPGAVILESRPSVEADRALARLRDSGAVAADTPVIQIAPQGRFIDRLAAVRAGCSAFFTAPVDIGKIIDHLDQITGKTPPELLRVLIVEDDRVVADYYAAILDSAGLYTEVVSDPLLAEDAILAFNPDLLLVNIAMPHCSGFELVSVLRQHESLSALPVVFITADVQVRTLRAAIRSGVDGFLTKPVGLADLIEVSRARAQRGRLFKGMVARDSLTGAYNHAMIHEMLATEIARAQREKTPFSVVMIDIDKFKVVNDEHGHAAGDLVIKSLVHRLMRDLRRTDIIGRYGGEEFTVLMPNTTADQARDRIDALREQFARTPFTHGGLSSATLMGRPPEHRAAETSGKGFTVTFSAGVAELSPKAATTETRLDDQGQTLLRYADDALYAAKRTGRNRVCKASADGDTQSTRYMVF